MGMEPRPLPATTLFASFAERYVASRLSRADCLVRTIEGIDVGVDLYCESVEDGYPFLHFWVQVKSGKQCERTPHGAKCRLERKHLEYWERQPVPVFIALLPDAERYESQDVFLIAISLHTDGEYAEAVHAYRRAIRTIENDDDPRVRNSAFFRRQLAELQLQLERAKRGSPPKRAD